MIRAVDLFAHSSSGTTTPMLDAAVSRDAAAISLKFRTGDHVRLKHDAPDSEGEVLGAVVRVNIEYLVRFPQGVDSYNEAALWLADHVQPDA